MDGAFSGAFQPRAEGDHRPAPYLMTALSLGCALTRAGAWRVLRAAAHRLTGGAESCAGGGKLRDGLTIRVAAGAG